MVEPPASCGITTRYDGAPLTVAVSDRRAALIDEEQYGHGEGPCLEAMDPGQVIEVPDQGRETRWARYSDAAAAQGVRCVLSLPLFVAGHAVGALNLYGFDHPHAFDGDRGRLEHFATQAATALALTWRHHGQETLAEQFEQALVSRSVIDQAMGIIVGQEHCTVNDAFDILRRHSQNTNRKLREVAAEIVEGSTGHPSPVELHPFHATASPNSPDSFARSQVHEHSGGPRKRGECCDHLVWGRPALADHVHDPGKQGPGR